MSLHSIQETWDKGDKMPLDDQGKLGKLEDLFTELDETLILCADVLGSKYMKRFKNEATKINNKLTYFNDLVEEWAACQKTYNQMKNIFSAKDIHEKLKEEKDQFDEVKVNIDKVYQVFQRSELNVWK